MRRFIVRAAISAAMSFQIANPALAASVATVTPQGEVAQVRQVVVRFSEAVVPFGDLRQADPFTVSCEGPAPAGAGRWSDAKVWLYDFRSALPPGTKCTLKARTDWKPLKGELSGSTEFGFSTGGPAVLSTQPWDRATIEEEQQFLLQLNGPALESSVTTHAWCEIDGIGERVPVRVVGGEPREAILKARRLQKQADRTVLLACQRPFAPGARVRLVWGKGIAVQANPRIVTSVDQRFEFKVREPFTAEFSCERERAGAPCLPLRSLRVGFSAPVPRALAEAVRLKPARGDARKPDFDKDDKSTEVSSVQFDPPLAENMSMTVELPRELKDVSGRPLSNASSFPLQVATGDAPPIAKFAAAPFGVIERGPDAMLPLTLRHVQSDLRPAAPAGAVRIKTLRSDEDILAWYQRVAKFDDSEVSAQEAGLPASQWTEVERSTDSRGRLREVKRPRFVATRELSLLAKAPDTRRMDLPQLQGGDPRPFEVVGIPLDEPGYHVVEIESRRLGESLLDKKVPMYVRTGVLVTNLGVHAKFGRENGLVWVTTLDRGQPVADVDVAITGCGGRRVWSGRTDAQGLARVSQPLPINLSCPKERESGWFVSARKAAPNGPADVAFVFSSWQKGIESWRFSHPTSTDAQPDLQVHTVFDRTLLRAGETVSMKHFVRRQTATGLAALPPAELPTRASIVHQGSGQKFELTLKWNAARSAVSSWAIPASAKLGVYDVVLERDGVDERQRRRWDSGSFRVEEFRLPLVDARVSGPATVSVAPRELPLRMQLNHLSGGPMAAAPARLSALLRDRVAVIPGYEEFSFSPPRDLARTEARADDEDEQRSAEQGKLILDKQALSTDANGAASFTLKDLPTLTRPAELVAELGFNDPNGEAQTASTAIALWPSAVVPGLRTGNWASGRGKASFQALALDTSGKPVKGQKIEVRGRLVSFLSNRVRLVGGFYAYDNRTEVKELGVLCSGDSDAQGLLACQAELDTAGQVELIAKVVDRDGHAAEAAGSIWVTRHGELWFAQDNDDRIDVPPEKKSYQPGETARLQVRMPYREATALVGIEREGVMSTQVVTLRGDNPTIELKIDKAWAPNIYVSVLALRGRLREVPWYSFFTWGWREPTNWLRAFRYEGRDYRAPTAMVDLAKPSFKLGVAAIKVGLAEHELQVSVATDKPQYGVRQKALARIKVVQDGKPLAGTEVAFAAVDEGLLALKPNTSWDLLNAMLRQRAWGVETATAQSEIIGRRHYGRKAVAAGGGGGKNPTRELFDTLLVWKPQLALDANGEAVVEVPLNDSLTSFRFVAIADAGEQRFGTGSTRVRVSQDLQLLPGLPPMVREGDRFDAMLTLRNTTSREMTLRASLAGASLSLAPQDVVLAAGASKEIRWPVEVPADVSRLQWEASVVESGGGQASDRVRITQDVKPAVPLRVTQATLSQLEGSTSLPVEAPRDALPEDGAKRGGIDVGLQPRLSGALPGIRRFFETYPFTCIEQKASKAIGLKDTTMWTGIVESLPTYLDRDGLATYFPPRAGDTPRGSDRLTAYLVAAAHEGGFAIPAATRDAMLDGLAAFVEGRIERRFWSPRADLDVRKLAAIEALSRHGRAQARMLGSIQLTPNVWPTAALIDWVNILKRVDGIPERAKRQAEAQQILRARLTWAGTTLRFSNEADDYWWWLMDSADANAARLLLAVMDDPAWKDDAPRLVVGALARQRGGAWLTTTANLWGSLALDKFSQRFESTPVAGTTRAALGSANVAMDWSQSATGGVVRLPWSGSPDTLRVTHEGSGKPWLTLQSLAAVPLKAPVRAGYSVTRSVTAVEQKEKGKWSRGDVMRVRVEIEAQSDMTWAVVSGPVPAGATLLGSGLGRDSAIATTGEKRGGAWPTYEERSFEAFRGYYEHLPRGTHIVEYTLRLNNAGRFALPPTRVEAMYSPETFGELPNAVLEVAP